MIKMINLSISESKLAHMSDDELQAFIENHDMHEIIQSIKVIQNGHSYYSIRVINQLNDMDRELISKINILNELNRKLKSHKEFDINQYTFHLRRMCDVYEIDDNFIDETKYALYTFPVSHTAYERLISECIDDSKLPEMIETLNKSCIFEQLKLVRSIQTEHCDILTSFELDGAINEEIN